MKGYKQEPLKFSKRITMPSGFSLISRAEKDITMLDCYN